MAAIEKHQVIIVCGETGSGKTTQLPKIALALGRGKCNAKPGKKASSLATPSRAALPPAAWPSALPKS
jgi:HrpA-like RNA helicase